MKHYNTIGTLEWGGYNYVYTFMLTFFYNRMLQVMENKKLCPPWTHARHPNTVRYFTIM